MRLHRLSYYHTRLKYCHTRLKYYHTRLKYYYTRLNYYHTRLKYYYTRRPGFPSLSYFRCRTLYMTYAPHHRTHYTIYVTQAGHMITVRVQPKP
jgi:hypothetical protein